MRAWEALLAALAAGGGIGAFINQGFRRRNNTAEAKSAEADAVVKIIGAGDVVIDNLVAQVTALTKAQASTQAELAQVKAEATQERAKDRLRIQWLEKHVDILTQQVIELGGTPKPAPKEGTPA